MSDLKGHICRLCGEPALARVDGFEQLKTVTSDCRPCGHAATLACCGACGGVQKIADQAWREAVADIYAAYEPYHQAGGSEQRVFDASGGSVARSERYLSFVLAVANLPASGAHLDVGCGNGGLLATMHRLRPGWELYGHELGEAQRENVCKVPGVAGFCYGELAAIQQRFDLVSMVHVLEHIEEPGQFLGQARGLLPPGGALAVEVPDWTQNPFDLLIFDHCTHFTPVTLRGLTARSGLAGTVRADQVPKEISAVLRPGREPEGECDPDPVAESLRHTVSWLLSVRKQALDAACRGAIGIFGTAIGATWLAGELGEGVSFFVDENPAMQGRTFMGRPVHAPKDIPAQSRVAVPLAPVVAGAVESRLASLGLACLHCSFEEG
jgi:SAM-dependent methyltransferase